MTIKKFSINMAVVKNKEKKLYYIDYIKFF